MAASTDSPPRLAVRNITKTFPGGVVANDAVSFEVEAGEIHGLLGENGAGKSTLMKVLYGLHDPDTGSLRVDGEPYEPRSPRDAMDAGIGMVHQHFRLVKRLSVVENVVLGHREASDGLTLGPFDWLRRLLTLDTKPARRKIESLADEYGIDVDPDAKIWELDIGEQQRVELLKTLYQDVDLLILDEPTAVLSPTEAQSLFETLRKLVDEGMSVILITHKLGEIKEATDRVTVLRHGEVIGTVETADATRDDLARMMVGREVIFDISKVDGNPGETVLSVSGLRAEDDRGVEALTGLDLTLRKGEILGIAGVSGNGQHELAECLVGVREPTGGEITIKGTEMAGEHPRTFVNAGVSYIPEDRHQFGCVPDKSLVENLCLKTYNDHGSGVFLDYGSMRALAERLVEEFDIRVGSIDTEVKKLSGGNLQKVILARELDRDPDVLIASQPTRGVDVGAIEFIRERLLEQSAAGSGIVLFSEELDEILQMSDRVLVIHDGRIVHETLASEADRNEIGRLMTDGEAAAEPKRSPVVAVGDS